MKRILAADGISELGIKILAPHYEIITEPKCSRERLLELAPTLDAIVVRSASKIDAEVINAAPRLKVIGRAGVGVDNIDIKAATAAGVLVINAPNSNTNAATEHTFALMLALMRHIPRAHASIKAGIWDRKAFMGAELKGKTLGLLGCGRIGAGVAFRAQAFGMRVLGYDPYLSAQRAEQMGIELAEFNEVLRCADVVSMHLPLTDETRGIMNKDALAKMKKGARLINASRGECMVLDDVYEALLSDHLAGAGLDVFEIEPLGEHPITKLDNVVLTPHLGANTQEAQEGVAIDIARSIDAAMRGELVSNALNLSPISEEKLRRMRPAMRLAKALGLIASKIASKGIKDVYITYCTPDEQADSKLIELSALCGMLAKAASNRINLINAKQIASERNIQSKSALCVQAEHSIKLEFSTAEATHTICGELAAERMFISNIDDFRVSFEPKGVILLLPHDDVPGMIGQVGTLLGDAGVNICSMQVGASAQIGENIMALSCASVPNKACLDALCSIAGIHGARVIDCEALDA